LCGSKEPGIIDGVDHESGLGKDEHWILGSRGKGEGHNSQ